MAVGRKKAGGGEQGAGGRKVLHMANSAIIKALGF